MRAGIGVDQPPDLTGGGGGGPPHTGQGKDAIHAGETVLLVDDLLATGGTAAAALQLVQQLGGEIIAASFLIELEFLKGREKLPAGIQVNSILKYR